MKPNKIVFAVALTVVLLTLSIFIVKDLNFHWIEVGEDKASVTINFLLPMDKGSFNKHIKIQNQLGYAENFACQVNWVNDHVCEIIVEEKGQIKGQKVQLIIDKAPTIYEKIYKEATIPIQFKTPIHIIEPIDETLISTTQSFIVKFNTPMKKEVVHKYLASDADFIIEPLKIIQDGEEIIDYTSFTFTPKQPLENDHKYILTFKKGMPSQSGVMLGENQNVVLKTDIKPIIDEVVPKSGSKWVGLYPRIIVRSKTPMEAAYIELDGELLKGELKNDYYAEFYPNYVLGAGRSYEAYVQIQAASGELSDKIPLNFTTLPLKEDRYWAEIVLGKNQEMIVYQGTQEIKRIQCSGGAPKSPTAKGTFYITDKGDKYFSETEKEGANYWLTLSEGLRIHGMSRNEHWEIKMNVLNRLGEGQTKGNVVMREEDALWLYNNLPLDTMVVIHP